MTDSSELAIYIHFPYCKSRCPYCDFFRGILPRSFNEEEFVKQYLEDISMMKNVCGDRHIKSIFFGGGTPSLLSSKAIDLIINKISNNFVINKDAEISIEANPNSYERDKFVDFSKVGINRLSLGVQSLNEQDLKFLGRTHSINDALSALECGASLFDKMSIDLIYARPGQKFEDWQKEIDLALEYGLKHISLYQLTLEEGTIFAKKNIEMLDEESATELYNNTVKYLRSKEFCRYEVSNFAKEEYNISQHNMVYWEGGDYWGVGKGAHGRVIVGDKIYAQFDGNNMEELSKEERAYELIIMGLRIEKGIDKNVFKKVCGLDLFDFISYDKLNEFNKLGLLFFDDNVIKLTDNGFLLMDKVILELCS